MKIKRGNMIAKIVLMLTVLFGLVLFIFAFYIPRLAVNWYKADPKYVMSGTQIFLLNIANVAQQNFVFIMPVLFILTIVIVAWIVISDRKTHSKSVD